MFNFKLTDYLGLSFFSGFYYARVNKSCKINRGLGLWTHVCFWAEHLEVVCSMSLKIYFTVASTAGLSAPVSARSNYRQLVQMLLKCVSLDGKCSGFEPEC